MSDFPKRSERTRRTKFKGRNFQLLLIANLWLIYFIVLSLNYVTSNTYSYFSDVEKIENTLSASDNFCADKEYQKNHKDACKDNAGLGNGSEPVDQNNSNFGDEDNPGHKSQYCDDPKTPEIEVCDDQNNGKGNNKNSSNTSGSVEQQPSTKATGTNSE